MIVLESLCDLCCDLSLSGTLDAVFFLRFTSAAQDTPALSQLITHQRFHLWTGFSASIMTEFRLDLSVQRRKLNCLGNICACQAKVINTGQAKCWWEGGSLILIDKRDTAGE